MRNDRTTQKLLIGLLLFTSSALAQTTERWVAAANGTVPPGSYIAGLSPERPLPVCRGMHRGGLSSGRLFGRSCRIAHGGREISVSTYEVLAVDVRLIRWVTAAQGTIPERAINGGDRLGLRFPICRANFRGGVHPGQLVGRGCSITQNGREQSISPYEVLVSVPPITTAPPTTLPSTSNASVSLDAATDASVDAATDVSVLTMQDAPTADASRSNDTTTVLDGGAAMVQTDVNSITDVSTGSVDAAMPVEEPERQINAGPIANDTHAQQRCPVVCSNNNRRWNGQWWTTQWAVSSVCVCVSSAR